MKKIILVDENEGSIAGHNGVYRDAINTIAGTEIFHSVTKFPSLVKHPISGVKSRWKYMRRIPLGNVVCLLHLDTIYAVPFLFRTLRKNHDSIVGVLHWFPKDKKRQRLLKGTAKYLDVIVVHSDYIKWQLSKINIDNVVVIDYPVFCNVDLQKIIRRHPSGKKVFTCLGGSRIDKGPDVLAESFKYIPKGQRDKVKIVVAGEELDVPYSFIKKQAEINHIQIEFCNKRMSNEEYWNFIVNTDVILLPYKRIFTGNSGPMTDGVSLNKYILGPNEGNLGYLIKKYNLGSTFQIENPESLGREIGRVASIDTTCKHEYSKKLQVSDFIEAYKTLFESL